MKKTTKLLATVAALGALATASYSFAAPMAHGNTDGAQEHQRPVVASQVNKEDMMNARFEGIARMLTLEANQKAAWTAYVDASKTMHMGPKKTWDKPAVDTQDRLERRIEMQTEETEQLKAFVKARAELLKVLNPSQKYVLEQTEMTHGKMMGKGMMGGKGGMMDHGGHGADKADAGDAHQHHQAAPAKKESKM